MAHFINPKRKCPKNKIARKLLDCGVRMRACGSMISFPRTWGTLNSSTETKRLISRVHFKNLLILTMAHSLVWGRLRLKEEAQLFKKGREHCSQVWVMGLFLGLGRVYGFLRFV